MTVIVAERFDVETRRPEVDSCGSETISELPEYFLTASQIRKSLNRNVVDSIKETLRNGGKITDRVSVSRIEDPTVLQAWLDLVNRARGTETSLDDCMPWHQDGAWHLVTSGHHRWQAVWELNQESLLSDDPTAPLYRLGATVHDAISVDDIFAHQKNGNNHTVPTKEEEASFTVMHWVNGRDTGRWTTKAEFIRENKEVSRKSLDDALHFADLPNAIQDFVWTGQLRYSISVELGRAYPYYVDYIMAKMGDNITPDKKEDFDTAIQMEMGILIHQLLGHGTNSEKPLSVLLAKKHVSTCIKTKQSEAMKRRGIEAEDGEAGLFPEGILYNPDEQFEKYLLDLKQQWTSSLEGMYATSLERADGCAEMMHTLDRAGTPPPDHVVEKVHSELDRRREKALARAALQPELVAS